MLLVECLTVFVRFRRSKHLVHSLIQVKLETSRIEPFKEGDNEERQSCPKSSEVMNQIPERGHDSPVHLSFDFQAQIDLE